MYLYYDDSARRVLIVFWRKEMNVTRNFRLVLLRYTKSNINLGSSMEVHCDPVSAVLSSHLKSRLLRINIREVALICVIHVVCPRVYGGQTKSFEVRKLIEILSQKITWIVVWSKKFFFRRKENFLTIFIDATSLTHRLLLNLFTSTTALASPKHLEESGGV